MAVLVTGAQGFLGSAIVRRFARNGFSVLATDVTERGVFDYEDFSDRIEYIKADIRDSAAARSLVERSGYSDPVIHLAGILTAGCDRDPNLAVDVNIKGLLNILSPLTENTGRRIVFASTIGVYGPNLPQPINESMRTDPDGVYGITKLMGEQLGLLYARRYGLDFRVVRFAAVTGPGRIAGSGSASLFTSLIPEMAARGKPYDIEVTANTAYPVVYIKDAINAIIALTKVENVQSRIFNISSGRVIASQLVAAVQRKIPSARFEYKPVKDIMAVVSGYRDWEIDCSKAETELGWKAEYDTKAMITDIIDSVRQDRSG